MIASVTVAAAALSYFAVAALRRWLEHRQVVDVPNERSSHSQPTPRGAGLVILAVTASGLLLLMLAPGYESWSVRQIAGAAAGATLVAVVSWRDDLRPLSFRLRFATHVVAALLAVATVGPMRVVELPSVGEFELRFAAIPLTVLWVVGLTSAYNFMDGIDGLAGGQAVVAGLGWAALGALTGQSFLMCLGLLIAASTVGFLLHNWHPAAIFMGDVGSATLGFTFAEMCVAGAQRSPALALAGALLVWPFVFDTAFTLVRRLRRGENVFQPHRSHLYQRLVRTGMSHEATTVVFLGLAIVGGVVGLGLERGWSLAAATTWILVPLAASALWTFVVVRERSLSLRSWRPAPD